MAMETLTENERSIIKRALSYALLNKDDIVYLPKDLVYKIIRLNPKLVYKHIRLGTI